MTFHYEATDSPDNVIRMIKECGVKAGISIKPATPVDVLADLLPELDLVLIMSVEPGKSGQKFINDSLSKIAKLNTLREQNGYNFLIEVDGGINDQTAGAVVSLGADVLAVGSAIYSSHNRAQLIRTLKTIND